MNMQMDYKCAPDLISLSELKWLNTQKNKKITDCEIEVLITELEVKKCVLFGGLLSGISNKRKSAEWKTAVLKLRSWNCSSLALRALQLSMQFLSDFVIRLVPSSLTEDIKWWRIKRYQAFPVWVSAFWCDHPHYWSNFYFYVFWIVNVDVWQ